MAFNFVFLIVLAIWGVFDVSADILCESAYGDGTYICSSIHHCYGSGIDSCSIQEWIITLITFSVILATVSIVFLVRMCIRRRQAAQVVQPNVPNVRYVPGGVYPVQYQAPGGVQYQVPGYVQTNVQCLNPGSLQYQGQSGVQYQRPGGVQYGSGSEQQEANGYQGIKGDTEPPDYDSAVQNSAQKP